MVNIINKLHQWKIRQAELVLILIARTLAKGANLLTNCRTAGLKNNFSRSCFREYFGCWRCTERFLDHAQLDLHARMVHSGPVHEPPIISITPIIEQAPQPPTPPPPPTPPSPKQKQQQPPQSEESSSSSTPSGSASIKYSCSDCSETFPSYVSMCKHRRSSHGTVGKHTKAASPQKVIV
jgi:hypothetical protein